MHAGSFAVVVVALVAGIVISAAAQDAPPGPPVAAPPSPFDRVVAVKLGEPFEYVAEFSGTLFVWPEWAPGEPTLVLSVGDAADDGDGGVRAPCIRTAVEPGQSISIVASGAADLHLVAAPETDATRSAATAAITGLPEVLGLREAGDLDAARGRLEEVADALLGTEGANHSEAVSEASTQLAVAGGMSMLPSLERLPRRTLEHRLRTLPQDHPDLTTARQHLALALYMAGDIAGARTLLEAVVAVLERTLPEDHPDLA
jgi:hypothetical protein